MRRKQNFSYLNSILLHYWRTVHAKLEETSEQTSKKSSSASSDLMLWKKPLYFQIKRQIGKTLPYLFFLHLGVAFEKKYRESDLSFFCLADLVRSYMHDLDIPDGLQALGYNSEDIPGLVEGTLPQHRVTKLSPNPASSEDLASIFSASMTNYWVTELLLFWWFLPFKIVLKSWIAENKWQDFSSIKACLCLTCMSQFSFCNFSTWNLVK